MTSIITVGLRHEISRVETNQHEKNQEVTGSLHRWEQFFIDAVSLGTTPNFVYFPRYGDEYRLTTSSGKLYDRNR